MLSMFHLVQVGLLGWWVWLEQSAPEIRQAARQADLHVID
jgi:hypothetical protein